MDGCGLTYAGKVRTNYYQDLKFPVLITTHRYFFSSGSDWPQTNCSLISSWRNSGGLCGYPTLHSSVRANQRMHLRPHDGVSFCRGISIVMQKLWMQGRTGRSVVWPAYRNRTAHHLPVPVRHSLRSRPGTILTERHAGLYPNHEHPPLL